MAATVDRRFRPDIEGLRAFAVGAVVLYHAWPDRLPGGYLGVDVFFVVSGFLITSVLIDELQRRNAIDLRAFYARRIRRLLPAAVLVLVVSAVVGRVMLPALLIGTDRIDLPFAAGYLVNFRYAFTDVSYFAAARESRVLHYWSLAVEEQFYAVWPLLLMLAHRVRRAFAAVVAVTALSLALYLTLLPSRSITTFFLLPTRAWELGIGALLAMLTHRTTRLTRLQRAVLATGGAVALVLVMFVDRTLRATNPLSIVPAMATVAILAAGTGGSWSPLSPVLTSRPAAAIGRWSYAIYLWHWPLLLVNRGDGRFEPSVARTGAVVALSIVLGALTTRVVERPLRRRSDLSPRRTFAIGTALTFVALVVTIAASGTPAFDAGRPAPAATALGPTFVPSDLTPRLDDARRDFDRRPFDGCVAYETAAGEPLDTCTTTPGAKVVVLLGDSHAAQWLPALLEAVASGAPWEVRAIVAAGCPAAVDVSIEGAVRPATATVRCQAFRERAIDEIKALDDPVVLMSGFRELAIDEAAWAEGLGRTIERISDARVVVLGDTPTPGWEVPFCLSAHLRDARTCSARRADAVDLGHLERERAAAAGAGAAFVDPTPWVCPGSRCRVIDGHVLVYADSGHLTGTYARTLAVEVREAIDRAA